MYRRFHRESALPELSDKQQSGLLIRIHKLADPVLTRRLCLGTLSRSPAYWMDFVLVFYLSSTNFTLRAHWELTRIVPVAAFVYTWQFSFPGSERLRSTFQPSNAAIGRGE